MNLPLSFPSVSYVYSVSDWHNYSGQLTASSSGVFFKANYTGIQTGIDTYEANLNASGTSGYYSVIGSAKGNGSFTSNTFQGYSKFIFSYGGESCNGQSNFIGNYSSSSYSAMLSYNGTCSYSYYGSIQTYPFSGSMSFSGNYSSSLSDPQQIAQSSTSLSASDPVPPLPPLLPPPFRFTVSLSSQTAVVTSGSNTSVNITLTLTSGVSSSASIYITGLPQGTTASLTPSSCMIPCSSILTFYTSDSTPAGNHSITVRVISENITESYPFLLQVNGKSYTVSFTAVGLPKNYSWAVVLNGISNTSTSDIIYFSNLSAGNYSWYLPKVMTFYAEQSANGTRYLPSNSSGYIVLPGITSYTISFVKQYQVLIRSTEGGNVSPSGNLWYDANSTVDLVASPGNGYIFTGWNTSSSLIIITNATRLATHAIIGAPGTITANFLKAPNAEQYVYIGSVIAAFILAVAIVAWIYLRRRGHSLG
ncbi:MAG: hypothetical protein QXV84_01390 [Conexivisphaerales archaeon]